MYNQNHCMSIKQAKLVVNAHRHFNPWNIQLFQTCIRPFIYSFTAPTHSFFIHSSTLLSRHLNAHTVMRVVHQQFLTQSVLGSQFCDWSFPCLCRQTATPTASCPSPLHTHEHWMIIIWKQTFSSAHTWTLNDNHLKTNILLCTHMNTEW